MLERIEAVVPEFEEAGRKTQRRAGKAIAEDAWEAGSILRTQIQKDIESARLNARELVNEVHRANKRSIRIRWVAVSLICIVVFFLLGCSIARML